jgi:hypothetical protein
MDKKKGLVTFLMFCVDGYAEHRGISERNSFDTIFDSGALDYLIRFYDILHTQSGDFIIEDVADYINKAKLSDQVLL